MGSLSPEPLKLHPISLSGRFHHGWRWVWKRRELSVNGRGTLSKGGVLGGGIRYIRCRSRPVLCIHQVHRPSPSWSSAMLLLGFDQYIPFFSPVHSGPRGKKTQELGRTLMPCLLNCRMPGLKAKISFGNDLPFPSLTTPKRPRENRDIMPHKKCHFQHLNLDPNSSLKWKNY